MSLTHHIRLSVISLSGCMWSFYPRSCRLISNIHSFLAQLVVKGADNPISNPISGLTQNLTLSLFASQQQEIIIHESPGGMYKAHK